MMRSTTRSIGVYAGAAVLVIWTVLPIYWLLNMSFTHQKEILDARLLPVHPTLCNYARIISDTVQCPTTEGTAYQAVGQAPQIRRGLMNSLIIAVVVSSIAMLVSVPVAYALGRFAFKRKMGLLMAIVMSRAYPPIAILIPFFAMYQLIGLQGTLAGLIIAYLTLTVPLIVWILTGFFASLPRFLEPLARVDGCTRMQALYRVIVPAAMPGVSACAVIAFLACWNEFTFAYMLTPGTDAQPFPPTLAAMFFQISYPGENAAAAMLALIPVAILAFVFQRRIRGLNIVDPL
jgi:multiple sugar transport system permease protein